MWKMCPSVTENHPQKKKKTVKSFYVLYFEERILAVLVLVVLQMFSLRFFVQLFILSFLSLLLLLPAALVGFSYEKLVFLSWIQYTMYTVISANSSKSCRYLKCARMPRGTLWSEKK